MTDSTSPPPSGVDPRPQPGAAASPEWDADTRPDVARAPGGGRDMWLIIGLAVLLGLMVLLYLGAHRANVAHDRQGVASTDEIAPPPPPAEIQAFEANGRAANMPGPAPNPPLITATTPALAAPTTAAPTPSAPFVTPGSGDASLKAPAMVVDLGAETPPAAAAGAAATGMAGVGAVAPKGAGTGAGALNGDEQFAERVGAEEPLRAKSIQLHNLAETLPQGAMIPGVLETALDSDLPGYARAVVSREVRGFDGTTVLIPRGSRVIGEYKSAVAQGQSRAFVIWTRILRPDGVSIQIGSSGTDQLGRAGLAGDVNRHFLEQFGGAILLSVINAGVMSISPQPSTEVVIGSSQQATSLAGAAVIPTSIPPTIKVPQGTPIRIFVARDLDFSPTGGVRP